MTRDTHWLLPVDPAAHREHLPTDWRTRPDAGAIWIAIGRTQPLDRWCLRTGHRLMRPGDRIWAYLSRRQELCAVGVVRGIEGEGSERVVLVEWNVRRTALLGESPLPRSAFGDVPMALRRAGEGAASVLSTWLANHPDD